VRAALAIGLALAALAAGCAAPPRRARLETQVLPEGGAVVSLGWDLDHAYDVSFVPDRGVGRVRLDNVSSDPPVWRVAWLGPGGEHALLVHEVDDELAIQRVPAEFVWTAESTLGGLPGKRWAGFPTRQAGQGGVDLILRPDGTLETVSDWGRTHQRVAIQQPTGD